MKRNRHRPLIRVTADGRDIVSHTGSRLLGDLADVLVSPRVYPKRWLRRNIVAAGTIAERCLSTWPSWSPVAARRSRTFAVLRKQPRLFGEVASGPTAWWSLQAIDEDTFAPPSRAREPRRGPQLGDTVPTRAFM